MQVRESVEKSISMSLQEISSEFGMQLSTKGGESLFGFGFERMYGSYRDAIVRKRIVRVLTRTTMQGNTPKSLDV